MERINNRYTRDMKQTAVEWFALELYEKFEMKGDGNLFDDLLEQAKEMEKQKIIKHSVELCKILISNPFETSGKTPQELVDAYFLLTFKSE